MEILGLDISSTWIIIVTLIVLFYIYGKKRNRYFKDIGIPGPEPTIYIGNFQHFIQQMTSFENPFKEKYGRVYGLMMGASPLICVLDPEILREVLIRRSNIFIDRMNLDLDNYPIDKGLFFLDAAEWKRIRHIVSPTFSGAKLRMMCGRINKCARILTDTFRTAASAKTEIPIKDVFGGYTMDVIASTAFSIDTDSQSDLDSQLMTEAKKVFSETAPSNPLIALAVLFPSLTPLLKKLGVATFPKTSLKFFKDVITTMITERKSGNAPKQTDFLQLLIDAEDDGTSDIKLDTKSKKLTFDEILGQALLFFTVGYETTANTLHFVSYLLATNPDVQQRVFEEIDTVLGNREPDYDNIWELSYLERVITESLRMFPVVPTVYRKAAETVEIKGYTIPKDATVSVPTMSIHRDPEIYPQPNTFMPDRWLQKSEMDSMNYLPFGHGPRHCIGMRLAQLEMRIALAHVIKNIRFLPGKDTPAELESKDLMLKSTFITKNPINLLAELR